MAKRDGRTEAPTPKRKREARREGRVPRSPEVVPIDSEVALAAGRLRARRERRGRPVAQADMLIAACALTRGLTLVTRNVADFEGCGIALLDPFD